MWVSSRDLGTLYKIDVATWKIVDEIDPPGVVWAAVSYKSEEWRSARLDPKEESPQMEDLAAVPFAARSLTFDGEYFWSNHRAVNETISFSVPG